MINVMINYRNYDDCMKKKIRKRIEKEDEEKEKKEEEEGDNYDDGNNDKYRWQLNNGHV